MPGWNIISPAKKPWDASRGWVRDRLAAHRHFCYCDWVTKAKLENIKPQHSTTNCMFFLYFVIFQFWLCREKYQHPNSESRYICRCLSVPSTVPGPRRRAKSQSGWALGNSQICLSAMISGHDWTGFSSLLERKWFLPHRVVIRIKWLYK